MTSPTESGAGSDRAWSRAFAILSVGALVLMAALSADYGIHWDEPVQDEYAQRVYAYYRSAFTDRRALHYLNLHLYGGLFELLCAIAERLSPLTKFDTRHLLNAIVGWIGMVYAARAGGLLTGPRTACVTLLLLLLSPYYFGQSMNNPKDIPFATAYAAGVYYILRLEDRPPFMSGSLLAKVVLAIAAAINVRFGGLVLIGYLWLALGMRTVAAGKWDVRAVVSPLARASLATILALVLGTLFWPWALQNPFVRPFQAMAKLSRIADAGRFDVHFAGQHLFAADLPTSYVPTLLAITTPLTVLVAALASIVLLGTFRGTVRFRFAMVWLAFAFPPLWAILSEVTLYDGIRHLLFVYPAMVILAAVACEMIWRRVAVRRRGRGVVLLILLAGLVDPLRFHVVNHPNQVAYFNSLVGGVPGAFGRYDIDNSGNSVKQALEWILEHSGLPPDEPIVVSGPKRNAFTRAMPHYLGEYGGRFAFAGWNKQRRAHFYVQLLQGDAPAKRRALGSDRIIHVIAADGAPLCLIEAGGRLR